MEASTLRAPAKLNLTLEVLRKREDGLHALRSVMVPLDFCDELLVEQAENVTFVCTNPELQEGNLVERALGALPRTPSVKVTLRKQIPTGAGMGGGSSDAAAILLAAADGLLGPSEETNYLQIARSLGSDVPFFLARTAALVEGTGERVTALGPAPDWHAVIVKPPASISTAWAYNAIDERPRESRARSESVSLRMSEAMQRADFNLVTSLLQNDFHDVIVPSNPAIAHAVDALRSAGAAHAMLTGSGSCVFALTQTLKEREALCARLVLPAEFSVYSCALDHDRSWRSAA